jgi:hypothetical protein
MGRVVELYQRSAGNAGNAEGEKPRRAYLARYPAKRALIFPFHSRPLPFSPSLSLPLLLSLSPSLCLNMSTHTHGSTGSSQNIVGVHYRVGKKIGEGSFGVIFEGPSTPSFYVMSSPGTLRDLTFSSKVSTYSTLRAWQSNS